jgi:hypothetical protein
MNQLDPHFAAAYLAGVAACDIAFILPESDLTEELRNLLDTQIELFTHMIHGKHYGTDNINIFIEHVREVGKEVSRIKGAL